MVKWLYRIPKSPQQVLAIINEANEAYSDYKEQLAIKKKEVENAFINHGIYVGTVVKLKNPSDKRLEGELKILDTKGLIVHILNEDGMKWRLKGYNPDQFEIIQH